MKYYKVVIGVKDLETSKTAILNELLTYCERWQRFPSLGAACFKVVTVPVAAVAAVDGVRFEEVKR